MKNFGPTSLACALALFALVDPLGAAEEWVTIRGQVVFDGPNPPRREPIQLDTDGKAHPDKATCAKDADFRTEDWVIDPKTKGVRDVFIWLAPDVAKRDVPFPTDKIHPTLIPLKDQVVSIDQPCCRFIPRALAARAGQTLVVRSSPTIPHNANFQSDKNGNKNVVIPAGSPPATMVEKLQAEPGAMFVACNSHPWMKSAVRIFDHPYYAVTDEDGKFEIKLAPVGKFRLYVWHPANGWKDGAKGRFGQPTEIRGENGAMDLKRILLKKNEN